MTENNFNLKKYENILLTGITNNYEFRFFEDFRKNKTILLRHDIDVNPTFALRIAKIEHELAVRSTFFFMLRSPFYNLFSRSVHKIVKEILEMNHAIGLHYDAAFTIENIQEDINFQIEILEKTFETKVSTVSFHQPSKDVIANKVKINQINTYDSNDMKGVFYMSDSNANWKENNPIEIIESGNYLSIQILTHPIWWVKDNFVSTFDSWSEALKINFDREQEQAFKIEAAYGPRRIFSIT